MICYSDATVPSSNSAVKGLIRFVSRFTRGLVEVVLHIDFIWYSKLVVKGQKSFREIFYTGGTKHGLVFKQVLDTHMLVPNVSATTCDASVPNDLTSRSRK